MHEWWAVPVSQPPIVQFQPVTGNRWSSPGLLPMIQSMPAKWLISLLLVPLAISRADAQNSDLALLAGIAGPHGRVVVGPNPIAFGSVGASGQVNYAWQVLQRSVDLYISTCPSYSQANLRGRRRPVKRSPPAAPISSSLRACVSRFPRSLEFRSTASLGVESVHLAAVRSPPALCSAW